MPENITSTGIDALLKYVNEHGETDVFNLSKAFGVDVSIIEQWANILENAKMVKVNYKLDKMYVAPLGFSVENLKALNVEAEVREKTITADIKSKELLLTQIEDRIDRFNKFTEDAQRLFKTNAGSVKKTLDELYALRKKSNEEYESIKGNKDYMDRLSQKIDSDVSTIRAKVESIKKVDFETEDAKKLVEDLKSKIKIIEVEMGTSRKKFNESIAQQKKDMERLSNGMDLELKSLRETLSQQEHIVNDSRHTTANFNREVDSMLHEIEKRSRVVRDRAFKTKNDIEAIYELAASKTKSVNAEIDSYISKFGELADIDKSIRDIKASLDHAKSECELCRQQFAVINSQLKEIEGNKKMSEVERSGKIKDMSGKMDDINSRIERIRNDVEKSSPQKLGGEAKDAEE